MAFGRGGRSGGRPGGGFGRGGPGGRGRGGGGRGRGGRPPQDFGPPERVIEFGEFTHTCEDDIVCKSNTDKVPWFNAGVYFENKQQIGKIDEIFGTIRSHSFSVKLSADIKASSFKPKDKVFIDPYKLFPVEKFLPGAPQSRGRGRGAPTARGGRPGFDRGRGRGGGDRGRGFPPRGGGDRGGRGRGDFAGGRGGGAGGGDRNCYNCNKPGHMSSECTEPRAERKCNCYNCGEDGHMSRDCPKPRQERKSGGGGGGCFNCGEDGHMSRDCPKPRAGRGGGGGFRGNRGGDRGSFRGRGDFGGQKRTFDSGAGAAAGGQENKKIKFEED